MATIIKHPGVEDYFVERTLDEITAAPNGLIPDYEANRLILLKNYRVDVDFDAFAQMSQNTAGADKNLRKTLKKLSATYLAEAWGADPTAIPYFQP